MPPLMGPASRHLGWLELVEGMKPGKVVGPVGIEPTTKGL